MPLLRHPYHFKHQKFADQRALVDAMAARAAAEGADQMAVFERERRQTFESHERAKADLRKKEEAERARLDKLEAEFNRKEAEIKGGRLSPKRKEAQLKRLGEQRGEVAEQLKNVADELNAAELKFRQDMDANQKKIDDLLGATTTKVDAIHNTFSKDVLPKAVLRVQNREGWQAAVLPKLKPVLDQGGSLHVIYQIFKITALLLLILSFLFVFVMAFRQLPLAGGSDELTDQLKGLIALKQGGGGAQEVARAAIFSVAAVGVGSAAVVAGNSIDRAIRGPVVATAGVSTEVAADGDPFLRAAYDSRRYAFNPTYRSNLTNVGDPQPTPDYNFSPTNNVNVPAPEVRILAVSDHAGTNALLTRIQTLNTQVQQLSSVTTLREDLTAVQKDVSEIKSGHLTKVGDEAAKANTTLGDINKTLNRMSADNSAWHAASGKQMSDTNNKLGLLGAGIDGLRRDALHMTPRSDGRNFFTRAGQFFGGESFVVSGRSYETLRSLLSQGPENDRIVQALAQLKSAVPSDKGKFLDRLRQETARGLTGAEKDDALKRLKRWEDVILSFTRLSR